MIYYYQNLSALLSELKNYNQPHSLLIIKEEKSGIYVFRKVSLLK